MCHVVRSWNHQSSLLKILKFSLFSLFSEPVKLLLAVKDMYYSHVSLQMQNFLGQGPE
jgi:hypothetical protein